ncbi:hypothetical protein [Microbacterium sp.]|uniref:hypothetical protein n=1 Tax=Microbacterium sp. TaxID=51671 RepID=UPI0033417EE1
MSDPQTPAPQPGYPAYSAYSAPQPLSGPPQARPAPAAPESPLGRIALIIVIVAVALSAALGITQQILILTTRNPLLFGGVGAVSSIANLVLFAPALILGILALRTPGRNIRAGIAVGVAAFGILQVLIGWIISGIVIPLIARGL